MRIIKKLVLPLGLVPSAATPIIDTRLADGTRVNVVIPPVATSGPAITIQRMVRRTYTLEQLFALDMLSPHIADFLRRCLNARLNIMITGVTGAGKTALLNAISSGIDENERIVLVEEIAELQLRQRHVIALEATQMRDAGHAFTTADLIANAQHMCPHRIIVGETRTSDAFPLIQAMSAGNDGMLTTIYANTPRDALARLESFALMSGNGVTPIAIRQQIATGLDLIIHCARLRDGTRRITQVTDIIGMDGDAIQSQDLFLFRELGLDMSSGRIRGEFVTTGVRASFASRIEDPQVPFISIPRGA